MASQVPPSLKSVGGYVKVANDSTDRDPVVYYWCLYYAVQQALKIDKSSKEALQFITGILSTLEAVKKQYASVEAIHTEIVAQAHLENYALKLFNYADAREKNGQADKATFHAFYNSGLVFDTLSLFGEIDENIVSMKKYAKYTTTQIGKCLRDGTPYVSSSANKPDELSFIPSNEQDSNFPPPSYNESYDMNSSGLPGVPKHYSADHNPTENSDYQPQISPSTHTPSTNVSYPSPSPAPRSQSSVLSDPQPPPYSTTSTSGLKQPTPKDFLEAQKFTKYALSAIDYEDTKAAVENLKKALSFME
ncbi:unnamed protein product [Auanema sp. JU1783]|nr:unnamed protein product [Auanema sp. JU1783]